VLLAEDTLLERPVALKILPVMGPEDGDCQEARMVATLAHPNILAIHDLLRLREGICLVMEYAAGGSCEALFRKPVPPRRLLDLAVGMASGLAHAHAARIVHRDLKPANVLLADDGVPKLSDFGVAKHLDAGQTLHIAGTPRYMAPEQRLGEQPSPAMDVYALGATLIEGATGVFPDMVTLDGVSPSLLLGATVLSEEFQEIIETCLGVEADDRYRDGAALLEALQALECVSRPIEEIAGRTMTLTLGLEQAA
jgi:serine/threonine protein kinase